LDWNIKDVVEIELHPNNVKREGTLSGAGNENLIHSEKE